MRKTAGYYSRRYGRSRPREARAGIKARTQRGRDFAVNWWSARWMESMEETIDAGRIARGKNYARRGQVVSIDIGPGLVTAMVQGSRRTPYQLRLGFDTAGAEARELILFRFREDAALASELLAGELPEKTEEIFAEAGAPLFPDSEAMRRFRCSCPDEAFPCKHVTAVLFLLCEEISCDPFLLLRLRGIEKEWLAEMLTLETVSDFDDTVISDTETESGVLCGGAESTEEAAAAAEEMPCPGEGWFSGGGFSPDQTVSSAGVHAAALEVMTDFPFWKGERPFRQTLVPIYERAALYAAEILTGERKRPAGRPRKIL